VLVGSTAGAGHFGPLVPILDAFERRGDDVLVVGPPSLQAVPAVAGRQFWAGAEPPAEELAAIWDRFPDVSPHEAAVLADREVFGRLCTAAMLPATERACDEWRPDLVVRETCAYAVAISANRRSVPHVQVAISLAAIDVGGIGLAAPVLQPHGEHIVKQLLASPYLTRFPPSLDPSPFASTRRFREAAVVSGPLPDWWGASTAPLVYVSFGSLVGGLPVGVQVYRAALEAVRDLPVRVLLTVGRTADPAGLGPVPPNVHVEQWVPQADVFAVADAVLCHGGSGTTYGALAAGLPLVVVPLFADQPTNGRLVAGAGAGVLVEPVPGWTSAMDRIGEDDAPRLRAAIETVLGEPSYGEGARRLAAEMAALPSVDELIETIATDLVTAGSDEHPFGSV
jgi:UDP:flavonoid glycosyltransferase YjiC (YdhE family)